MQNLKTAPLIISALLKAMGSLMVTYMTHKEIKTTLKQKRKVYACYCNYTQRNNSPIPKGLRDKEKIMCR